MKIKNCIYCLILLILLTACTNNDTEQNNNNIKNLHIELEEDNKENINNAKILTAKFKELSAEDLPKQLLHNEITKEKIYAFGPQFETDGDKYSEVLMIYDDGEAFGEKTGIDGGFNYTKFINENMVDYQTVASLETGPPHLTAQLNGYSLNSDYQTFENLDFQS